MAARLEVVFINRSNRHNTHQGIENIGGRMGSKIWKNSSEVVIDWIEHGLLSYYVKQDGREVDVLAVQRYRAGAEIDFQLLLLELFVGSHRA